MHAIILAGGLGTRLREAVPDLPKPMAPVGGRPFLEYLVRQLRQQGYRDVVLCLGYRAEAIRAHFGDGAALGVRLRYSVENEPLGTAGALRLAASLLEGGRWLVLNGDSFFGISFDRLVARHEDAGATATLALRRLAEASRFGVVELDRQGRITRFAAKGAATTSDGGLVNGGAYVIERTLLEHIAPDRPVSLESEVFAGMIDAGADWSGQGLQGVEFEAPFVDIGVPEDYLRLRDNPVSVLAGLAS